MTPDRETALMHRATSVPLGKQWADQEYRDMLAASIQAQTQALTHNNCE